MGGGGHVCGYQYYPRQRYTGILGNDRESVALGGSYFSSDPKDRKKDERKRAIREEKGNYEYPRNIIPRGFIPGYLHLPIDPFIPG